MFFFNPLAIWMDPVNQVHKFYQELTRPFPEEAPWVTENRVVLDEAAFCLRLFGGESRGRPTLIIPPQAGQHSNICDFNLPGRSLVQTCLDHGRGPVYAVEWKSAVPARKDESLDDLMDFTRACLDKVGGKVHLIGLCQGGWQAAVYTALFPEQIATLTLAGAPIDFGAGDGFLKDLVHSLPMSFYEYLVEIGQGVMKGDFLKMGFKNLKPLDRYWGVYLDLMARVEDEKYLMRYRPFRDWYEYPMHLPGKWYLQAVSELFRENRLVRGELKVKDCLVDLKRIECPVVLVAGQRDHITPVDQLFNSEKYVSSENIAKILIPDCGHIGVFMGVQSLRDYWPRALALAEEWSGEGV